MTVDLSEMSPQVAGYYNSGATAGRSAAQVAFKCLTSPGEFPINDGALTPLEIVLPPGTVVSATKPSAMRWWMTYPMTVVDCIFRALAPVLPDISIAGHHADLGMTLAHGLDPNGRFFQFLAGPQGGGWGATSRADGQSATICVNDGDTHNAPIEVTEAKSPAVTVEEYALVEDSGGPGRHRGGLGTRMRVRMNSGVRLSSWIERTACPPWGLEGGQPGMPNRIWIERASGEEVTFPNGKVQALDLAPGDSQVIVLGGGGGFGAPDERPVEQVLADVRAGYVSAESAERDYRVSITSTADGELVLDAAATSTLRDRSGDH
jgi:N-methylhydantoinase B